VRIRSANDGSVPVSTGDVLCVGDNSYAETLANQFTALVDEEPDADRLACYRGDVHRRVKQIVHVFEPETCTTTAVIDAKRFPMEMRAAEAKTLEWCGSKRW
jgi:hypothetical protein